MSEKKRGHAGPVPLGSRSIRVLQAGPAGPREGVERGEDGDPRKTYEKLLKYMAYR